MNDLFDRPDAWASEQFAQRKRPRPPWLVPLLGAVAAAALLAGVLGFSLGHQGKRAPLPTAQQVLASANVGSKQVYLADYADGRHWLTFYQTNQALLGEPERGEGPYGANPRCVEFQNYVVCHSSDPGAKGTDAEYSLQALGDRYVGEHHLAEQLDAAKAGPVETYIASELVPNGQDWLHWLGRPLTAPTCTSEGVCYQAFEHEVLQWPSKDSVAPTEVRLTPLGVLYAAP
jgi:hypothetical protein